MLDNSPIITNLLLKKSLKRWYVFAKCPMSIQSSGHLLVFYVNMLKGKLGKKILLAESSYRTLTKRRLKRQFSPKSPEVGKKSDRRVQNWPNKNQLTSDLTWGHPQILSSELLREPINSVIRPTEGIDLLTISASDLLRESTIKPKTFWEHPKNILRTPQNIWEHMKTSLNIWGISVRTSWERL